MMHKHVITEANRCFKCKNPQCVEGCPVSTPIPTMIEQLLNGRIREAGKMLFENNPLSVVCSLVCPHDKQCEGHCVLGKQSNPIQISAIEHYISDYYLNLIEAKPEEKKDGNIGIIGTGPTGITIAFLLAQKGYRVTMFEAHDKIGGILRYGIPDFRLPKYILEQLKNKLREMGVKIRPNILIGSLITVDELFRDGFDAVVIGTGVWKPRKLGVKGESLGHVHYALDYLKNPDAYDLGRRLCVIGAGNVAMDVSRTAIRKGTKDVYLLYRKGPEDVRASKGEQDYAKMDGVKFEFYKRPVEITANGVMYVATEKVQTDNGMRLRDIEGSQALFEADSVIIAIGQEPRANIVSSTQGIETDERGLVVTDECGRTTRAGVFAAGDVVTGARSVVEAVRLSKKVAEAIEKHVASMHTH